jgi:GT2 family glycosyltransferase
VIDETGDHSRASEVVDAGQATSVVVAVITYRRPEGLERLLRSLSRLRFAARTTPDVRVLVVDNDPEGSARSTCDRVASELPWPLDYRREPRRGIASARNRALAESSVRAPFTAFLDDDEYVEPDWLDALLRVAERWHADVVFGPVMSDFETNAPAWVHECALFVRPRRATGARVLHGGAGNCLLRNSGVTGSGIRFDERFGATGGEDTHFFLRLGASGASMRWADDAVVHEMVPPTRTRMTWVWRRAFRIGCTWSISESSIAASRMVPAMRVIKGVSRCLAGLGFLVLALGRGRGAMVRAGQHVCLGAGNIAGVIGFAPRIYS